MKTTRWSLGLLALTRLVHGDTLPYNPTHIFLSPNTSFAYIFGPSSQSHGQAQLSVLDISNAFSTTNHGASTISQKLPFLQQGEISPYAPAIDDTGTITVLAGKCSEKASSSQVWQFQPEGSLNGQGTWKQHSASYKEGEDVSGYLGLGFLSNSISFSDSPQNDAKDTSVYVFGGMCPYENSTTSTWISRAEYSNSMLTISAVASDYDISVLASRGPPISQAGSSITALAPTYGLNNSGAAQPRQQDFVLLGGNTEAAFINMSQVALFSLPQESWSFVDVSQPTNDKTDLTVRQAPQVTPRSGHTAVLSESGDSIILFGGWVGDVDTPAEPQLAILELGAGYGGSGGWKWTIPQQSGKGLDAGKGIYGHGATLLPGGVMMVMGGYEISGSSSGKRKRSQAANSRVLLYNATSQAWLQSYSPPAGLWESASSSSGPLSHTSQKVGLGTGLGIGAALLLTMIGFYVWYGKRVKSAQEDRERALLSYSSDGSHMGHFEQPFLSGGMDGRGSEMAVAARSLPRGENEYNYPRPLPMQHSTGAWVDVPSPTRGLRKGSAGKYQYHAAPRYDDKRISRGSGSIHPIAEHENEDDQEYAATSAPRDRLSDAEKRLREVERVLHSDDPFTEYEPNPLGSHPIGPVLGETVRRVPTNASKASPPSKPQASNEKYAANWTVEDNSRGMLFEEQEHGFTLINGDDRTSSTLSERSQHSTTSSSSITRTMSTKTGAILSAAAAAYRLGGSPQRSPTYERSNTLSTNASFASQSYAKTRGRSSTHESLTGGDGDSFISARSNFVQLQSEGEALLGGRPLPDPDDPYQRAIAAQTSVIRRTHQALAHASAPPPPQIPPRRRPGLMGSLRRALNVVSMGDRSVSLTAAGDQYEDGIRTSSSSPTKDRTSKISNGPRRAVSDGGPLLAQKRGQKDWDENDWSPYRDDPNGGDWGEPRSSADARQAEEEWDVESAAINRDFQIMFSIPKSKLRVVNDDMDRASLKSASDGGVSRNGSVRRDGSLKALKVRTDGENLRLPSTAEEMDEMDKEKAA